MEMGSSHANAPSPTYEFTALSCQGFWTHGWLLAVTSWKWERAGPPQPRPGCCPEAWGASRRQLLISHETLICLFC